MPSAERMLVTHRRALDYVRATPGRRGHFVALENAQDILVAGDLHGHLGNFQEILKRADLAHHPRRHLLLQEVVHSPFLYPRGGDKSHQLLDLFAALKCQYPERVHLIPGNHELAQMTGRSIGKGEVSQNEAFVLGVKTAYGEAAPELIQQYNQLIVELPLAYRTANHVFLSHSLIDRRQLPAFSFWQLLQEQYQPTDYEPGGMVYSLVWGRDTSEETCAQFLQKVEADFLVSGHIPTDKGYDIPNGKQIIVDCSDTPAAALLFPAEESITLDKLQVGIQVF